MSSTVVPFRPRRSGRCRDGLSEALHAPRPRAAALRIDGAVSLYQLLTGLQSVGLSFRREPGSGVYIISPRQAPQGQP